MKSLVRTMLVAVAIFATCSMVNGQNRNGGNGNRQNVGPEKMIEFRANRIADSLEVDAKTKDAFVKVYSEYMKEAMALRTPAQKNVEADKTAKEDKAVKGSKQERRKPVELTEDQIKEHFARQFEQSQKQLDLKVKYYKEFSKILTQKQVKMVFDMEERANSRFSQYQGHGPQMRGGMQQNRGPQQGRGGFGNFED